MDDLPEELVLNIFHRLPVKALGLCMCVKKIWIPLIKNPTFVSSISKIQNKNNPCLIFWKYSCRKFELRLDENNRFDIYNLFTLPLDPKSYDIDCGFPVCNGMLCLAKRDSSVMLWNPTVQKLLTLPKSNLAPLCQNDSQYLQFWFDSLTDDYKVIRFVQYFGHRGRLRSFKVEICSLTCNGWKTISDILYTFEILGDLLPILNGTLHCIVSTDIDPVGHSILGFDVNAEVFRNIELPNVLSDPDLYFVLAIYKQTSIAVICHHFINIGEEVWVMKEYGNVESWTKIWQFDKSQHPLLRVPRSRKYRLNVIGLLNNGEVLWEVLLKTRRRSDADPPIRMNAEVPHMLYLTNLERKENENLEILPESYFKFGVRLKYFEESLVLLDNANATTL